MYRNFRSSKLQNVMSGYYSETYFLQKCSMEKWSISNIEEVQNSVAPLILEIDKSFPEITNRSTQQAI